MDNGTHKSKTTYHAYVMRFRTSKHSAHFTGKPPQVTIIAEDLIGAIECGTVHGTFKKGDGIRHWKRKRLLESIIVHSSIIP